MQSASGSPGWEFSQECFGCFRASKDRLGVDGCRRRSTDEGKDPTHGCHSARRIERPIPDMRAAQRTDAFAQFGVRAVAADYIYFGVVQVIAVCRLE